MLFCNLGVDSVRERFGIEFASVCKGEGINGGNGVAAHLFIST